MSNKGKKIINKRIEIPHENSYKLVVICFCIYYFGLYLYDLEFYIKSMVLTLFFAMGLFAFLTSIIFCLCKIFGEHKEGHIDFGDKKQYIVGLILVPLSGVIGFAVFGKDIFGNYNVDTPFYLYLVFLLYYIVTAICEELVFRVCLQGELSVVFEGRLGFIAPIISAALFSLMHNVQIGNTETLLFTFLLGLLYGFAKKYCKSCTYISLVLAHLVYDFVAAMIL